MGTSVSLKMSTLREFFIANWTFIWFLTCVYAIVFFEIYTLGKLFIANDTHVWLYICVTTIVIFELEFI
jgi:hypothetical protein